MIAAANGLLSTLSPGTSTGKWIGYQIILGTGRGLGMQMVRLNFSVAHFSISIHLLIYDRSSQPIIAVQNTLPPTQIAPAMALLMFSTSFGGALFLSFGEVIFSNSLKALIPIYAPAVDPQTIIDSGATGFRTHIHAADLAAVLVAYAKSVDRVFYLTAGLGVGCFIFAWGMGWKDIRKKKQVSKA